MPMSANYIAAKIKQGKVVPVVSQKLLYDMYLGDHMNLVKAYAEHIEYPFKVEESGDLLKMIKYRKIKGIWDKENKRYEKLAFARLRDDYLGLAKQHLLRLAEKEGTPKKLLDQVSKENLQGIGFSELTKQIDYPHFGERDKDPLLVLAKLPLPIYLTTCHHTFLEQAIRRVETIPDPEFCRSEFCRWHKSNLNITLCF